MLRKCLFLFLSFSTIPFADGYVAHELSRGALELRSQSPRGFTVSEFAQYNKVTYFCLQEASETQTNRKPQSLSSRRCFFVPHRWNPVHLSQGYRVLKVRYQLKGRMKNRQGKIPVGFKQYFYPVQNITLVSTL